MKKFAGDIIILHMCTKNHNYMMYGSSTEWNRQHFLSFWTIFCPFTPHPLMIPKIKILKKNEKIEKNALRYYPFIYVYHKCKSYDIWFLKYKVQQTEIVVILGHFLPFQPPDNLENQHLKIEKKHLEILPKIKCTKNHDHMLYCSLDMACNGFNCYFSFWAIVYQKSWIWILVLRYGAWWM